MVHVAECKSYFDNPGIDARWLKNELLPSGTGVARPGVFKLFKDDKLREVVFGRLEQQLVDEKRRPPKPKLRFGLVCGHTKK